MGYVLVACEESLREVEQKELSSLLLVQDSTWDSSIFSKLIN